MEIGKLVSGFKDDLVRLASVSGGEPDPAADRLLLALEPALRLTLMEAISQATAEIGARIPGVAIDVRLSGREPMIVVEPNREAESRDQQDDSDDENTSRITLRLPESLKTRAETFAAKRGQSLNTWLVAAIRAAADSTDFAKNLQAPIVGRRMKGWVR